MQLNLFLFIFSLLCSWTSAQNALGNRNFLGIGDTAAEILQQTYDYFQQGPPQVTEYKSRMITYMFYNTSMVT